MAVGHGATVMLRKRATSEVDSSHFYTRTRVHGDVIAINNGDTVINGNNIIMQFCLPGPSF